MKSLSQSDKVGYVILLILCGTLALISVASRISVGRLHFNVAPLLFAFALPPIYGLVRKRGDMFDGLSLAIGVAGISVGVFFGFVLLAVIHPSAWATRFAVLNGILPIVGVGACVIALKKTDQNEEYRREYERKHPKPDFANMTQEQAMAWITETQAEMDEMLSRNEGRHDKVFLFAGVALLALGLLCVLGGAKPIAGIMPGFLGLACLGAFIWFSRKRLK